MPASRGNGILQFRDHWTGICNYQYQNILDRFKIKTLTVQTNQIELILNGLAPFNYMVSYGFLELINTLGVAVPTSHHWPLGDEGKQAMLHRGGSGPPPYPCVGKTQTSSGGV